MAARTRVITEMYYGPWGRIIPSLRHPRADPKYSLPGGTALWNLSHCGERSNACSVPVAFVIQLVSARSQLVQTVMNGEVIDCVYENRRHSVKEASGLLPAAPGERSESGHSGLWRPGVSHAIRAFNRPSATYR